MLTYLWNTYSFGSEVFKVKGGRDFKFDERETENKHFKEVILSQEWIDAFLKEDKPEERYETFIEYFGDKKIDEYYKKLTSLITLNNKKIDTIHIVTGKQIGRAHV